MTVRRALAVALAGLISLLAARACWAARETAHLRAENARLRAEATLARLQASGYQTTLAHVTTTLRQTLADRDHWRALAEEPDAEPVAYVRATAEAEGRVEGEARIVDGAGETAEGSGVIHYPGFEGIAQDDVFAVRWQLRLVPERRFVADVRARVPLELVAYRLPDDAIGVTAVSPDPRIRIEVEDFYWQPPKVEGGCGFWCKAKAGALGALVGAVMWEVAR